MKIPTLSDLRFSTEDQEKIAEHIKKMASGPTDCVVVVSPDIELRADILYALLGAYTSEFTIGYAESFMDVDVVTIESKTTYTLPTTTLMVRQVSLEEAKVSSGEALMSALRSDPAYVLMQEVTSTDGELVVRSAMTGHRMLVGIAGTKKEDALAVLGADAGGMLGLVIIASSRDDMRVE